MRRSLSLLALPLLLAAPLGAQTGEALIREIGGTSAVTNPTFAAPHDLIYPKLRVQGFGEPANFLRLMDVNGVARSNVKLAIIVHGTATPSLLNNAAYKTRTGADNASIALLTALHEAGVQIIVCGQALINRNVPRDQLLPFVKVATTATSAHGILAAQGYAVIAP
jgi:intracellular sulfur oxidation DsrE/DsrF family protein